MARARPSWALQGSGRFEAYFGAAYADHQMSSESARITLLREIETFLEASVPSGDTGTTGATR